MVSPFHNERNISFCRAKELFIEHKGNIYTVFGNKLTWKLAHLGL